MKRGLSIPLLIALVVILLTACNLRYYPADIPRDAVDFYCDYLDALRDGFTDELAATYLYSYENEPEAFVGQYKVSKYEITAWTPVYENLWAVTAILYVEDYNETTEGTNYIAKIDGQYKVCRNVTEIPDSLIPQG